MAIAFVQQAKAGVSNSPGFSGGTVTLGAGATTGNCMVIGIRDYNAGSSPHFSTISSVTDTAGNTYSLAASYTATDPGLRIYVAQNITGGFTAITVNVSTSTTAGDYWWIWSGEYSGVATTGAVDTGATGTNNNATTTSLVSSAITTAASNEAIILFGSQNNLGTYTAGTNFTLRDGGLGQGSNYGGVEDYITTGTLSSYTAGMTSTISAQYTTAWVALKPSAGGGSTQSLFRPSLLNGIGSGGPFFNNPIGRSILGWRPKLVTA